MDEQDFDAIVDVMTAGIMDAANTSQGFIACLAVALVNSGALSMEDLEDALAQEQLIIEGLRREGLDPRARAFAFERLHGLIERRISDHRGGFLTPRPWRLDRQKPEWPRYPDDGDHLDPANQP